MTPEPRSSRSASASPRIRTLATLAGCVVTPLTSFGLIMTCREIRPPRFENTFPWSLGETPIPLFSLVQCNCRAAADPGVLKVAGERTLLRLKVAYWRLEFTPDHSKTFATNPYHEQSPLHAKSQSRQRLLMRPRPATLRFSLGIQLGLRRWSSSLFTPFGSPCRFQRDSYLVMVVGIPEPLSTAMKVLML